MTKTDTYKGTERVYSKRVFNVFMFSLLTFVPFVMFCMLIWYKPITDILVINIIITVILIVIPLSLLFFMAVDELIPPKVRFNKKVIGTVKEKVLCKYTSTIYTVEGDLMHSTDKVYFEIQEGTKYKFLINKYNQIGKYKPITTT